MQIYQLATLHQRLRDFVKMTLTRVASSYSVKNVTRFDSIRATIVLNVTWVESESPKIVTWAKSLTRVMLSLLV